MLALSAFPNFGKLAISRTFYASAGLMKCNVTAPYLIKTQRLATTRAIGLAEKSNEISLLLEKKKKSMYKIVSRPQEFITHLSLRDNLGARKAKRRLGRGLGGGRGKRSGRGQKGWKARGHGRAKPWRTYEGGQTPSLTEMVPKWGVRPAKRMVKTFNLDKLKLWIDKGRIDPTQKITVKELRDSKIIKNIKLGFGVKVLGNGADFFSHPIQLEVQQATKGAIEAIEKAGGRIETRYYDRISMMAKLNPERFAFQPKYELPKRKQDIAYYCDSTRRGYLSEIAPSDPRLLIPTLLEKTKPTPGALEITNSIKA